MALTKVRRGGTDTGISDSSDATAITIDSSENITTTNAGIITAGRFINGTSSNDPWLKGVNSSGTETFFVKPDGTLHVGGDVGIGTSSLTGGNTLVDIHSSGSGVGANIAFANDHNTDKFFVGVSGDTNGDAIIHNAEDSDMIFGTNNGERFRITSVGRINANTGLDTATAFRFFAPSGQATKVAEFAIQNGTGCHLPVNSTAFTASSDETLKENITEFNKQESYDNIKKFRAVTFNFKDWTLNGIDYQDDKKRIGFIAQDWVTNYPEIIDKDQNDKLCMKYTETIPVLLSALQKAQEKIEALEARVTALESK